MFETMNTNSPYFSDYIDGLAAKYSIFWWVGKIILGL